MNIILIGAQGSGKGTQAEKLATVLGIHHISSGDLFRQAASDGTTMGLHVKEYLDRGALVPDDLTIAMIQKRIDEPDALHDGVLLDGFPRTISQAQALDKGLAAEDRVVDCAIYLNVPRDVLLRRLSGRYICRAHQHVYNIETNAPKKSGVCDLDGSELYQRSDDKGEAVQVRLDTFFNATIRLLDYYRQQQKLVEVDGNQGIELVEQSLLNTVRKFH